eukprot:gene12041-2628_t
MVEKAKVLAVSNGLSCGICLRKILTSDFLSLETSLKYITKINGEEIITEIMDTAERSEEARLLPCAQWADCFVLVFSIVDKESFIEMTRLKNTVDRIVNCNLKPMVILGNKLDLDAVRDVPYEAGIQYASEVGCPYHELSARESYVDVEKVFATIIEVTVRCSMINQLNKLYIPSTQTHRETRERRTSFKSIVKNFTRQKAIKEEIKEIKETQIEEKNESNNTNHKREFKDMPQARTRQRSSTCTF